MAVSDYNVEPGLNVSISGINIAEGCAPSGINDAIRQLMADVKAESEAQAEALAAQAEALAAQAAAQAVKDGEQESAMAAVKAIAEAALPKAGGEMTGAITLAAEDSGCLAHRASSDSSLILAGGADIEQGANLVLHGKDSAEAGSFTLEAVDGNTSKALAGRTDGSLQWGGRDVLTSAGGSVAGSITQASDDACLVLGGSKDLANGALVELYGHEHAECAGWIHMRAKSADGEHHLRLKPDGELSLDDGPVITLAASWRSGTSWYRKYSDGWIEQGGRTPEGSSATVTFPIPFKDANYTVTIATYYKNLTGSGDSDMGHRIGQFTQTTFYVTQYAYGATPWYACGY